MTLHFDSKRKDASSPVSASTTGCQESSVEMRKIVPQTSYSCCQTFVEDLTQLWSGVFCHQRDETDPEFGIGILDVDKNGIHGKAIPCSRWAQNFVFGSPPHIRFTTFAEYLAAISGWGRFCVMCTKRFLSNLLCDGLSTDAHR